MCGIAGFVGKTVDVGQPEALARAMAGTLTHRGPDDGGVWTDAAAGVALAHRRLSVLDLSPEGRQPMTSADGRYVIVYNGEIYNHTEMRAAVGDHLWRGHSDTEVLVETIARWGIERTLKYATGMFALAVWDRQTQTLILARDRLGEKPLYYGHQAGVFLFGSELKALRAYPGFRADVDRQALTLFLRHNAIPAPYSIYQGIRKLPPGTYLSLTRDGRETAPISYWSAHEVAEHGVRNSFGGTEQEAIEELDRLLRQAVAGQMMADVPLGAFLSGGIDSSTVVALMQAQSKRPVKTFTVGFWEKGYDEAQHAQAVAKHLGTDHTELRVTPAEALAVIPRLPQLYDEPFADSSQIPTFLISQLARRQVTVSLSGDGGDEVFGGYNRYVWAPKLWRTLRLLPRPLRTAMSGMATAVSPNAWDSFFSSATRVLPRAWRYSEAGDKLHKLAEVLDVSGPDEIYWRLISLWKRPSELVRGGDEPSMVQHTRGEWGALTDFEHRMMYLDLVTYLPDDILVKVDRAAMGVCLETRVPFLDHRVVEFAWKLPLTMKIRNGTSKWILRQVLNKYVPQTLTDRPKMGFGIPISSWLRGPLRDWAENLLDPSRLRDQGYFNPVPIRDKWQEHLSGKRNWQYQLWSVLMFQTWAEAWR
jgi:asparagine synthase (glutamine-hydrolysing)